MENGKKSINDDNELENLEKMFLEAEDEDKQQAGPSTDNASSLLQSGEGDSSDDEEQRDFQSCKYNEFGRDINKKLKSNEETRKFNSIRIAPDFASLTRGPSTSTSFLSKAPPAIKPAVVKRPSSAPAEPAVFCDPVFGLRIVQPLISSTTLKERMEGRTAVGVQRARFHTERGDTSKDWAIAGVLVGKSPVRQTQKGDAFSIWSISDLRGDIKMVSVFLFRAAHKELWKTNVGTVIGILNPKILERKDDKVEAVLSVDNNQKVMILGQSKDLGTCRAKKNNGDPCGSIINKTDCDVCIFHMKKEYSKIKRSEFQSSGLGVGLQGLRNKVLGKSEVFYAGQSFSAQKPAKKTAKMIAQDRDRLMTLSEYSTSPYQGESSSTTAASAPPRVVASQPAKRGSAASLESNVAQRKKDMERLKLLQGTETPQISSSPRFQPPPPAERPKMDSSFVPKLSGGSLTFTLKIPVRKNELAKQRAAAILQKKPLEARNPNLVKYRGTEAGKKRLADELSTSTESHENDAKKVKLTESEETQRRKAYLLKMMNATSTHTNLVEDKEAERREKCFDSMEKKEAMEERMANTMELKVSFCCFALNFKLIFFYFQCKAVVCRRCKYIYFSASDMCKQEKHELKVVDAVKRFYACGDCKARTVTLFRIPRDPCTHCRSRNWKRTGMMKEREAYVGEQLSLRGDEEMYVGGASNVNINLLVPESSE